ncbi:hypothetical protein [Rhodococcoides yunnanense]|uniref:hypothetical protein n=1 Tax=Rhodococcoides yunnanense TaxID=278209 RepID=UPI000932ABE0|nr:hypothetical protein [Rhodococcus yunnanensis]
MSVQLRKLDCPTCSTFVPLHTAPVEVNEAGLTNAWSALLEVQASVSDYADALAIYTAHPTTGSRALVAMAGAQLMLSVSELPEV